MTTVETTQEGRSVPWWLVFLEGIAAVIIGIFLLTSPGATLFVLIQILAVYWFISGIFSIISIFIDNEMWGWKLFVGILGIIAGVIIIRHPLWSTLLVPTIVIIILGIEGLIMGVIKLIMAFKGEGWGAGILGVLSIIFGLILLSQPVIGAAALPYVLGIFGIIGGIFAIVIAFKLK
ncbi:MAG: DUF308 domain-containing protein [Anaerolineales bacterium]